MEKINREITNFSINEVVRLEPPQGMPLLSIEKNGNVWFAKPEIFMADGFLVTSDGKLLMRFETATGHHYEQYIGECPDIEAAQTWCDEVNQKYYPHFYARSKAA